MVPNKESLLLFSSLFSTNGYQRTYHSITHKYLLIIEYKFAPFLFLRTRRLPSAIKSQLIVYKRDQ